MTCRFCPCVGPEPHDCECGCHQAGRTLTGKPTPRFALQRPRAPSEDPGFREIIRDMDTRYARDRESVTFRSGVFWRDLAVMGWATSFIGWAMLLLQAL